MRDKIAASALLVEEGAAGNVRALDELLALVAKAAGAREVVGQAIEALKALFHDILLPDRRLVAFADRPFRCAHHRIEVVVSCAWAVAYRVSFWLAGVLAQMACSAGHDLLHGKRAQWLVHCRAAKPSKENDKRLLLWWVEDCVKKRCALRLWRRLSCCACCNVAHQRGPR